MVATQGGSRALTVTSLVLDVCCGSEKIYQGWQKKLDGEFITMDRRKGDLSFKNENDHAPHIVIIKPKVLGDMRFLPFKDGVFTGIICDPPHLQTSATSALGIVYGSWDISETIRTMRIANEEFNRVLQNGGFLFLKIMADRKNIFLTLLNNFTFFLPIQLKRPRGSFAKAKAEVDGALWMVALRLKAKEESFIAIPSEEIINPFVKKERCIS